MSRKRSPRRTSGRPSRAWALAVAILVVLAALVYIIFAEEIAALRGRPPFSALVRYFAKEPAEGTVEVHFIDVGQADSILIRSREGNVLIDAGTTDTEGRLQLHLDRCGIDRLDYFICTHPHDDHIGGADMILDFFEVGTVILPEAELDTYSWDRLDKKLAEHAVPVMHPMPGDALTLGEMEFLFLAPIGVSEDLNDMSIVTKLTVGEISFLFTGDAEEETETELLVSFPPEVLDCDILKVGHHGAATSSTAAFLEAVSPLAAVISVDADNEYGHPHDETLARIAEAGIDTVLRTDALGTIVITTDGTAVQIPAPGAASRRTDK